jgi:hypothetical protein
VEKGEGCLGTEQDDAAGALKGAAETVVMDTDDLNVDLRYDFPILSA